MHLSNLLALLCYLLFLAAPLFALPLTISSQPTSPPTIQARHQRHTARALISTGRVITLNSLTHHTKLVELYAFYPSPTLIRIFTNIYFQILFNLSTQGPWFNVPPMSRVLIKSANVYLEFLSTDPDVPVPWQLVKEWAEALDFTMSRGGFLGFYTASFERLTGNRVVDYWIHLGAGEPFPSAATAARRKGR